MKKIFIITILCMSVCAGAYANNIVMPDTKTKIELIEKEINTFSGNTQNNEDRLKNAEMYVFGVQKSGSINKRMDELSKVLGLSFTQDNNIQEEKHETTNEEKTNYPAIDKIEKQVFGKTYEKENIYTRLDRLERKILGKTTANSLNERVSFLQEKTKQKINKNYDSYTENNYNSDDYNYYSSKAGNPEISIMEKKLLGKNYDNENLENRLSRLEMKLFGKTFDTEREDVRTERLKSVYKAAKSGTEYKVNKFAKYAFAGAQIGGILLLILAMIL